MLNSQGHLRVTQGHLKLQYRFFIIALLNQVRLFYLLLCTTWQIIYI